MNKNNLIKILKIIVDRVQDINFVWRLEWSTNLKIQNIDTSIKDIDITTNDEWVSIFEKSLKDFVIESWFRTKTKWLGLICNIEWFDVEINSYWDRERNFFDKTEKIIRQWLEIPILPLKYAIVLYENIGRKDKVNLISKYLLK